MSKKGDSKKDTKKKKKESEIIDLGPEPWVNDLNGKVINDDEWSFSLTLLLDAKPFYSIFLSEFHDACWDGYRSFVRCISMSDVIRTVWTNLTGKDRMTPLSCLCDEIRKHAGRFFNNQIPTELLSSIIKYIILGMKERDIKRQRELAQVDAVYSTKLESYRDGHKEGKLGKGSKASKKTPSSNKSSKKEQSNKMNPLTEKVNVKIHKRGEELKCLESLKDLLPGGPNLYIFLNVGQHFLLPYELCRIGVPLTAIIQVGYSDEIVKGDEVPLKRLLVKHAKRNREIRETLLESETIRNIFESNSRFSGNADIRNYWAKNSYSLNCAANYEYFKDLIVINYIPKIHDVQSSQNFILDMRANLYNGFYSTMCGIFVLKKYYDEFQKEWISVDVSDDVVAQLEDLKWYLHVLDFIPLDAITNAFLLDTLVAQVCIDKNETDIGYNIEDYTFLAATTDEENKIILKEESKNMKCLKELISNLNIENRLFKIDNIPSEIDSVNSENEITQNIKIIINGDIISSKLLDLPMEQGDFVRQRSLHVQKMFWDCEWKKVDSNLQSGLLHKYLLQMAKYVDKPFSQDIIEIFIGLSEIERSLCCIDDENYDFIFLLNACNEDLDQNIDTNKVPDYIEKLVYKLMNFRSHRHFSLVEKYIVQEKLNPEITLQKMCDWFKRTGTYKVKYCPLIGKLLLKFYDLGLPRKRKVALATPISFSYFVKKLLMSKQFTWTDCIDQAINDTHLPNYFRKSDAPQYLNFPIVEDSLIIPNPDECIPKNPSYLKFFSEEIKSIEETNLEDELEIDSLFNELTDQNSPFSFLKKSVIYDISPFGRVEFNFSDVEMCYNQGLLMCVKYRGEMRGVTWVMFEARFNKKYSVYYHTNIIPQNYPVDENTIRQPSLRFEHMSGIIFTLSKIPFMKKEKVFSLCDQHSIKRSTVQSGKSMFEALRNYESQCRYDLKVSWPNGLLISLITSADGLVYVKQQHLFQHNTSFISNELFRCNLSEGVLIIFMKDNSISILYGNSKTVNCTQYSWISNNLGEVDVPNQNESIFSKDGIKLIMETYTIRYSDGRICSYNNSIREFGNPLYVLDFEEITSGNITTEFSDGVLMVHSSDGTLCVNYADGTRMTTEATFSERTLKIVISEENIFYDILNEEFIIGEETVSKEKFREVSNDSVGKSSLIDLFPEYPSGDKVFNFTDPEEYILVDMSFKIENPHYATTVFNYEGKCNIINMPNETQVKFTSNRDIHIIIGDGIDLFTTNGVIVAKEIFEGKMRNEIVYSFEDFIHGTADRESSCLATSDNKGNFVILYDTGEVQTDNTTPFSDMQDKLKERYFIVDKDYHALELISNTELQDTLRCVKSKDNSVIQVSKNETFQEYLTFVPTEVGGSWLMPYDQIHKGDTKSPSTYGPSWAHPFSKKVNPISLDPEALIVRFLKKITYCEKPKLEFQRVLKLFYENIVHDVESPSLNETTHLLIRSPTILDKILTDPLIVAKLFKRGTILLKDDCETKETVEMIRNRIILPPVLVAIYIARLQKVAEKFLEQKESYLKRSVPPYFNSSSGLSYLVIKEALDKTKEKHEVKMKSKNLENLLSTSLSKLTDENLKQMAKLIREVRSDFYLLDPSSSYSLEEVLEAGRALLHYFQDMNAVLEFHKLMISNEYDCLQK